MTDLLEYWGERAAIREFDGGMSREDAERAALIDVWVLQERGSMKEKIRLELYTPRLVELLADELRKEGVTIDDAGNLNRPAPDGVFELCWAMAIQKYEEETLPDGPTTKEGFQKWMMENLAPEEFALINTNLYYTNPFYYLLYHTGLYSVCRSYLEAFRSRLTIEHTPEEYRKEAMRSLESVKVLFAEGFVFINKE